MIISPDMPDLTGEEVERCWLTPAELCLLAAVGFSTSPYIKRLLNTLSDRRIIPFVKSGTAKTSPRLYSLASAAMLRTIYEITRDGRTYEYARPIAEKVYDELHGAVYRFSDLHDYEVHHGTDRIVFAGVHGEGKPSLIKLVHGEVTGGISDLTYSVFDAGYLIFSLLNNYPAFWHDDLVARGVIAPPKPRKIGLDGYPIEGGGDD